MRLKLSIKFYIAFLATSFTIVVVMIAAMQFYVNRSFSDYIQKVEVARLSELGPVLSREYLESSGWQRLRDDPERWHELVRPRDSAAYAEKPPIMPSNYESYLKSPPPRPQERENRPPRRDDFFDEDDPPDRPERRPPPRRRNNDDRPPRNRDEDDRTPSDNRDIGSKRPVFTIEHRLALFDADKRNVVGKAESTEDHTLMEITVHGKIVGWLGLRNQKQISNPLDTAFLKQQSHALYVVGALTLILAAVVAFVLSRHLLAPVKQLIQGTHSLTSRQFNTRITVNSSDELGQLAADFNQMAHTLEQYEHMRQQWITDIAHELRTPLSILRGEIEALLDGIRETSHEHLESLHEEVLQMSQLVGNLHDLSLAESAALHIKREPIDLVRHARACLQKFHPRFTEHDIRMVDELGSPETIRISGDPNRLTQVFSNLLENTLRYTDSPGSLIVRCHLAKNHAKLQFDDTHPGVPTESLDRLFDRLYRVDLSRSRIKGGSGLGLSICKTIVEAHEGAITARHSALGGLRIEIDFPLMNR
jgi:two-component system sensor histidine kinase BaeS